MIGLEYLAEFNLSVDNADSLLTLHLKSWPKESTMTVEKCCYRADMNVGLTSAITRLKSKVLPQLHKE